MSCTFQDESPNEDKRFKDFRKGIWLTALYFVVELATGLLTHSVSMVGDSCHMFIDLSVQLLTYKSYKLRNTPPRNSMFGYMSFGFRRVEVLVTIFNVLLLLVVKVWLAYEIYLRLFYRQLEISTTFMLIVAFIGLLVNIKVLGFWHEHGHNHGEDSVKSVRLHVRDDLWGSVIVIISAVIMMFGKNLFWVDSIAAMGIAFLLLKTSYKIFKSATGIIMEAVPVGVDFNKVLISIKRVYGVEEVLDLHINKIGSGLVVLIGQVFIKSHVLHDLIPGLIKAQLQSEFSELKNVHLIIETKCHTNPA